MQEINAMRHMLSAALAVAVSTIVGADATLVIPIHADPSVSPPIPSVDDAAGDLGGDPNDDFKGLRLTHSLEFGPDGVLRAVADVHAIFDDPSVRMYAVVDASISVAGADFIHDSAMFGILTASPKSWAPQFTFAAEIDSFVTIGGPTGAANLTVLDAAWHDADPLAPAGVSWFVLSDDARHAQPLPMGDGSLGILIARLVTAPACEYVDSGARLDEASIGFSGTILWTFGDRMMKAEVSLADAVAARQTLSGDLNCDGIVDGTDLGFFLDAWRRDDLSVADLNGDGTVDGTDLGVLLANWSVAAG